MNTPRTDFGGAASNFSIPKNDSAKRIVANGEKSWASHLLAELGVVASGKRLDAGDDMAQVWPRMHDVGRHRASSAASARHAHRRRTISTVSIVVSASKLRFAAAQAAAHIARGFEVGRYQK